MSAGEKGAAAATWDVEVLVAMQLAYIRGLAVDAAGRGERVQDVVVTVPAFFSQFERDAIADAVELAGLRLLAFVNDGAAIAVNYAMTRQFPQKERHIVYDAGAGSTRATIATFTMQGKKQDATLITVNGVGYDRLAGGTELDRRLREILVGEFESKHGVRIRDDPKAMMKLWKEAGRIKAILSANTEASARVRLALPFVQGVVMSLMVLPKVESVYDDIDFSVKVTRQAFEDICTDMKLRFVQPIYDALDNANLTLVCGYLMRYANILLRAEWIGGHRFGYLGRWSYAYTNGQGSAGSSCGGVRSHICFGCAPSITKPLSGIN